MRRSASVRVRVLTAVLMTAALGMLGAGSVSYLLARHATLESVERALEQEHEEIDTITALSASGEVGHDVTSPSDVLRVAIRQTVPDPDEAIMGLVDGRVVWTPVSEDEFQVSLARDESLVRAASAARPGAPVVVRQVRQGAGRTAYISVPVQVAGSSQLGHYVAAVDVRAAMAPVVRTHLAYAAICLVALATVALVGHRVVGRLLAPLRALRETAQLITETDLAGRIPADQLATRDEVSTAWRADREPVVTMREPSSTPHRRLIGAGQDRGGRPGTGPAAADLRGSL